MSEIKLVRTGVAPSEFVAPAQGGGAEPMPTIPLVDWISKRGSAVDAGGRDVPLAQNKINFEISGPGRIIGVGKGDSNCHEPEQGNQRSLCNGLAQVIVQSADALGEIKLTATAEGLASATATLQARPVAPRPSVP